MELFLQVHTYQLKKTVFIIRSLHDMLCAHFAAQGQLFIYCNCEKIWVSAHDKSFVFLLLLDLALFHGNASMLLRT